MRKSLVSEGAESQRDEIIIKELNKYINDLQIKGIDGENSKLIMLSLVSVLKNIMKTT